MPFFYLEVVRGMDKGKRYAVPEGAVTLGRSSANTIALNPGEKSVSGHHAILYRTGDSFLLQDMDSTNGTYVQDQKIKEQQISVGAEIGLGKTGPRLTLISSENELTIIQAAPGEARQPEITDMTTGERIRDISRTADTRAQTDSTTGDPYARELYDREKLNRPLDEENESPSLTMDMERKILEKRLDSTDMRRLMGDRERVDKILERGNLGATQTNLLRVTVDAHRRMRWQWFAIGGALLTIVSGIALFFGIRATQYKSLLNRGLTLEQSIIEKELRIAQAHKDSLVDHTQLKRLIDQLDSARAELGKVKAQLTASDIQKFYNDPLEEAIDKALQRFGETDYHIPPQMVERVRYHIQAFSGPLKATVTRYIKRRETYFPMIIRIFTERHIPPALAYVSMLESGFNPLALSHAGARGLWQFMEATGRRYGLRVDASVDERTDPEKSTRAAAEYFKDLIGIFGGRSSVMLCMAAYNAGEGRIMNVLRKIEDPMRNRDFWYIYRMGFLAEETREYIPKVIALMIISENPSAYGFDNLGSISEADLFSPEYSIEDRQLPPSDGQW